ncbi:hypothetical protein CDAR_49361 [Caerostris darwini]|uniref:Uncharacterized protein n=1 Tax=Caerostris darwini TaxID=1538125 RepID=A0AAV4QBD9_9ARAC|nr:hypothetical protein CDAR_49361 [Caerostris darwini]
MPVYTSEQYVFSQPESARYQKKGRLNFNKDGYSEKHTQSTLHTENTKQNGYSKVCVVSYFGSIKQKTTRSDLTKNLTESVENEMRTDLPCGAHHAAQTTWKEIHFGDG